MMKSLTAIFLLMTAGLPAFAVDAPNCESPMSTAEINSCLGLELDEADKELNSVYRERMREMTASDAQMESWMNLPKGEHSRRLRNAQRAWITFRDAECAVAGLQMLGGSGESTVTLACLVELTRKRTEELRRLGERI